MLDIKNLTKTYAGGKTAVNNLSLSVDAGDIFGFIGHNGAGKTTKIKCVVEFMISTRRIMIDGSSIKNADWL